MTKISAVIITYNGEGILPPTVRALDWCDEIIVVDSGSTDNTVELCRSFNCRVFQRELDGRGPQKQFGVEQARNDWVLSIDQDEVVSRELAAEIQDVLNSDATRYAGMGVPFQLVFMNHKMRHVGRQLRVFDRTRGEFDRLLVHEAPVVRGPVHNLEHHAMHYSYRDTAHYFEKFNLYTSLVARQRYERGTAPMTPVRIAALFPYWFLVLYFRRRYLLDGFPGFAWALFSALDRVVVQVKLRELYQPGSLPKSS